MDSPYLKKMAAQNDNYNGGGVIIMMALRIIIRMAVGIIIMMSAGSMIYIAAGAIIKMKANQAKMCLGPDHRRVFSPGPVARTDSSTGIE